MSYDLDHLDFQVAIKEPRNKSREFQVASPACLHYSSPAEAWLRLYGRELNGRIALSVHQSQCVDACTVSTIEFVNAKLIKAPGP